MNRILSRAAVMTSVCVAVAATLFLGVGATSASALEVEGHGILEGNQVYVPAQVPVNVCGDGAGSVLGVGVGVGACVSGQDDA